MSYHFCRKSVIFYSILKKLDSYKTLREGECMECKYLENKKIKCLS